MPKYYKLRLDIGETDSEITEFLKKHSPVYARCVEGGVSNPHSHWYLELEISSQHVRKELRVHGMKGNGSYSLKELDEAMPIEYLAYMMKEGDFCSEGIPEDILARAQAHNDEIRDEIRQKKEGRKTVLQKIDEALQEEMGDKIRHFGLMSFVQYVISYYKETGILYREFQIVSIAQTLYLKYNDEAEKILRDNIDKRLFLR